MFGDIAVAAAAEAFEGITVDHPGATDCIVRWRSQACQESAA